MGQVYPRIMYDNVAKDVGAVSTYSGTETVGFELVNAFDWRDFTAFRAEAGTTIIEITLASARLINAIGLFILPNGATIDVQVANPASQFASMKILDNLTQSVSLHELTNPQIPEDGMRMRLVITTATPFKIRQICIGEILKSPIGQMDGINPANLNSGIVVNNQISVNGSVIGRSIRRRERTNTIDLDHVTETWVRTEWERFTQHMNRYACFYAWDIERYPNEVSFGTANGIPAPTNMTPVPFMKVSLPLRVIDRIATGSNAGATIVPPQ